MSNIKYVFKDEKKSGLSLVHPIYSFGVERLNEGCQPEGLEYPSHSLGQKNEYKRGDSSNKEHCQGKFISL